MGFPRLSETFIASELLRIEQAGVPMRLFVVKPIEDHERGLRLPVVDAIHARPARLPAASCLTLPLHRWRPRHLAPFVPAIRRIARRRPRGLAAATATVVAPAFPHRRTPVARTAPAVAQACRDRRTPLSGLRKIYVKELLQAISLADRLIDAPEV